MRLHWFGVHHIARFLVDERFGLFGVKALAYSLCQPLSRDPGSVKDAVEFPIRDPLDLTPNVTISRDVMPCLLCSSWAVTC